MLTKEKLFPFADWFFQKFQDISPAYIARSHNGIRAMHDGSLGLFTYLINVAYSGINFFDPYCSEKYKSCDGEEISINAFPLTPNQQRMLNRETEIPVSPMEYAPSLEDARIRGILAEILMYRWLKNRGIDCRYTSMQEDTGELVNTTSAKYKKGDIVIEIPEFPELMLEVSTRPATIRELKNLSLEVMSLGFRIDQLHVQYLLNYIGGNLDNFLTWEQIDNIYQEKITSTFFDKINYFLDILSRQRGCSENFHYWAVLREQVQGSTVLVA